MTKEVTTTTNGKYKLLSNVQQKVIAVLISILGIFITAMLVGIRSDVKANALAYSTLSNNIAKLDKKVDLGFKDVNALIDDVDEVSAEFKEVTERVRLLELGQ